jgi:Uncharacterized protein conserved in bacteria (DUF2188)
MDLRAVSILLGTEAMADMAVIRVLNQHRRWVVQLDGREDVRFNARGRGRAVEAALDLAETVSPALVVVHTADGRVRRTISVGAVPTEATTPERTRMIQ